VTYAADDGRKLWEHDLPYSAHSVPGTYVWKGKRYVVICAGGHGKVDGSKLNAPDRFHRGPMKVISILRGRVVHPAVPFRR
jgi:hypothetical protein